MATQEAARIQTLMILDDAQFDHKIYSRVIARSGIVENVISFYMAEDALAWLAEPGRPEVDVILLDINMPRMSGFEFLDAAIQRFGEDFAASVVVMLTTSLAPADIERAGTYAMVRDYINKPLQPEHLPRIANLLEAPKTAA